MQVVILAGGLGTRLAEETRLRPKPMVEIGGRPILWHIMNLYASQGFNEFVVALGYKGEVVKDYFLNFYALSGDVTVNLATGRTEMHGAARPPWEVHLVETGLDTQTGGRVGRLRSRLQRETVMLTYGDSLANVDLHAALAFHRAHGKLATVTAVRPPARFGVFAFDGDRVTRFAEKPQLGEGWINGGFFILEPGVLDYVKGDETIWEHDPLERLAVNGQLFAYRHEGFWQTMDTLRDRMALEELWDSGRAPWSQA